MNVVKVGKLPATYFQIYPKLLQVDKNLVTFCSTVQRLLLVVLFWKYRLWVDFKIKYVLFLSSYQQARKKNKIRYIGMSKWEQLQLTLNI